MALDLRHLIRLALRWWWLLILAPFVAGIIAYSVDANQGEVSAPSYTATTLLMVNPGVGNTAPVFSSATMDELLHVTSVLQPVVDQLSLPFDASVLSGMVTSEPLDSSAARGGVVQLIRLYVTDFDPQRAADIANEVASSFATYVAAQSAEASSPYRQAIDQQRLEIQSQIDETSNQIAALEDDPTTESNPVMRTQLGTLRAVLAQLQQTYARLVTDSQETLLADVGATSRITVAEAATAPMEPDPQPASLPTAPLGALAGLLFVVALILLLEYLDNTIKTAPDAATAVRGPLLAAVPKVPRLHEGVGQLYAIQRPGSPASEAIRRLRANLEFSMSAGNHTTLAITSAGTGEGRSTIAANLAVAFAQAGSRTVLVDADLRSPRLHKLFDVSNQDGLPALLKHASRTWDDVAIETSVHNLALIPGDRLANAADLLSGSRLVSVLKELAAVYDIVIVDTPPVLAVSDALEVARSVDGVAIVCRAGRTRVEELRSAVAALRHANARIVGAVLNLQSSRESVTMYHTDQSHSPNESRTHASNAFSTINGHAVPTRTTDRMTGLPIVTVE
jgi:non-specific protein-tyrosine kinase